MAELFFLNRHLRRHRREFRPRLEIGGVRDIDFISRYRCSRQVAQHLVEVLGQDLAREARGGQTITPETKVSFQSLFSFINTREYKTVLYVYVAQIYLDLSCTTSFGNYKVNVQFSLPFTSSGNAKIVK